jgi:hypothetical protein
VTVQSVEDFRGLANYVQRVSLVEGVGWPRFLEFLISSRLRYIDSGGA